MINTDSLKNAINDLKEYYDKLGQTRVGRFQRLFFPIGLRNALEKKGASHLEIGAAAFSSTWFFHRLFFPFLSRFFKIDIIQRSRWLFDPKTLPLLRTEEFINNDKDKIESDLKNNKEIQEAIVKLKAFYKTFLPFSAYLFPSTLVTLLTQYPSKENTNTETVDIILAVHKDVKPYWHELFFYSPFKTFRETRAIDDALTTINKSIIPKGPLRVQRNLETLNKLQQEKLKLKKPAGASNTNLEISDRLDLEIATIISLLNPLSKNSQMNAQKQFEKIRIITENRSESPLFVCDALSLYFKNNDTINLNPDDEANDTKIFNKILDAFAIDYTSQIYAVIRDKKIPLLQQSGSVTRQNIIKIAEATDKANICDIYKKINPLLLTASAQENFDRVITHPYPPELKQAIQDLIENNLFTQQTFEKVGQKTESPTAVARGLILSSENIIQHLVANHFSKEEALHAVANYPGDTDALETIVVKLAEHHLLNADHFKQVLEHSNIESLEKAINHLAKYPEALTQSNLENICTSTGDKDAAYKEALRLFPETIPSNTLGVIQTATTLRQAANLAQGIITNLILPANKANTDKINPAINTSSQPNNTQPPQEPSVAQKLGSGVVNGFVAAASQVGNFAYGILDAASKKIVKHVDDQQLTDQQPAVQQPGDQQPAVQQSVVQQPAVQQPADQQPTVQQPVDQQPADQQPTANQQQTVTAQETTISVLNPEESNKQEIAPLQSFNLSPQQDSNYVMIVLSILLINYLKSGAKPAEFLMLSAIFATLAAAPRVSSYAEKFNLFKPENETPTTFDLNNQEQPNGNVIK